MTLQHVCLSSDARFCEELGTLGLLTLTLTLTLALTLGFC